MAFALVGTIGAVSVSPGGGGAVTPNWGTGESRTAGNLLVCWYGVGNDGTNATVSGTGWLVAKQAGGTSQNTGIAYKVATGGDAAPTITPTLFGSGIVSAQVAEFSGGIILENTGTGSGTSSPQTVVCGSANKANGNLVLVACAPFYNAAATKTTGHSLNNGATANTTKNDGTSTANHYSFTYGITTGHSVADSDSYTFTTTNITGNASCIASFRLPVSTDQALAASLNLAGTQPRAITSGKTAALTLVGTQSRSTTKGLTASFTPTSALKRAVTTGLAASLSFAGHRISLITTNLAASLSFSGTLASAKAQVVALAASLNLSGAQVRTTRFGLTASLTPTGTLSRVVGTGLAAALTFDGNLSTSRFALVVLVAALSFAGNLSTATSKRLAANFNFVGTLRRTTAHGFTAALSWVSSLVNPSQVIQVVLTAALTFSGDLKQRTGKRLNATLAMVAAQSRTTTYSLTAHLSFASTLPRAITKRISSALRWLGKLHRHLPNAPTIVFDVTQFPLAWAIDDGNLGWQLTASTAWNTVEEADAWRITPVESANWQTRGNP